MGTFKYDHVQIADLRDRGLSWDQVIEELGLNVTRKQAIDAHYRWAKANEHVPVSERRQDLDPPGRVGSSAYVGLPEMVGGLEDLIRVLGIDEEEWEVTGYPVKTYPVQQKGGRIIQGATISANLKPNTARLHEAHERTMRELLRKIEHHDPYQEVARWGVEPAAVGSCAAFINVYDAHLGMLAHGKETEGINYDLDIGRRDYLAAAKHQIDIAMVHPVRELNVVIGHDLQHIDKIHLKVGMTAAGTPQDFDSRLHKIFSTAAEVAIEVIEYALSKGVKVNVWFVPGNHDPDSNYKLGLVIFAWFHGKGLEGRLEIHNGPNRHRRHLFGKNSILMTHGERSQAKQRSLPMKALATMPDEHRLALATHVEILCGHLHTEKRGSYVPSGEVEAEMNVTVRNLRGLTAIDSWHELQDYGHVRGSDLLIFHEDGGVVAQHTYFPHIHGTTDA